MITKNIRWILALLLVVSGLYAITYHGEHIAPYLPFTFFLGCLVMHLFMHSSHHGHDHNEKEKHE